METRRYIGNRIREAREGRRWSQRELAAQFGVSPTTVHHWEKGNRPIEFADIERVAQLLEKPVQFFLPEWYIDPRGLSPEMAQLVHRLNALPHGDVRDRVITNFLEQIGTLKAAMEDETGARDEGEEDK